MAIVQPIKPSEVAKQKLVEIPDFVIESFNELIAKNWDGNSAVILQKDVVSCIQKKKKRTSSKKIFDSHWLDVEDIFEKAGWTVEYDKPGFNESYEASFEFSKKVKK